MEQVVQDRSNLRKLPKHRNLNMSYRQTKEAYAFRMDSSTPAFITFKDLPWSHRHMSLLHTPALSSPRWFYGNGIWDLLMFFGRFKLSWFWSQKGCIFRMCIYGNKQFSQKQTCSVLVGIRVPFQVSNILCKLVCVPEISYHVYVRPCRCSLNHVTKAVCFGSLNLSRIAGRDRHPKSWLYYS